MNWITELFMLVNGLKMDSDMERACKCGKTALNTKVIGKPIWQMERGD